MAIDIAKTRDEIKKLHDEASAHVEKYSAEGSEESAEDAAAQKARFERMDSLQKQIDAANKLATYSFAAHSEGKQPVAAKVVLPAKSRDQIIGEAAGKAVAMTVEQYAAEMSAWAQGQDRDSYAALTTASSSGIFVPSLVSQSINLTNNNPFRQGLDLFGLKPVTYGGTAKVVNPVVSPFAGAALPEDGTDDTDADANTKIGKLVHIPKGYHSTTFWYSGLEVESLTYDITASHYPALSAASDMAAAAAVTAAIKADSAVTLSTTTASTTTITPANIDSVLNKVAQVYRSRRVLHLSPTAYAIVEAFADTTGRPLLTPDLQNQSLLKYRGVPVIMDPTLDAMGTSTNLVGMVVSYTAFEWRDEIEKMKRYENESKNPDKVGLDHIRYCDGAYFAPGIAKLVN